MSLIVTMLVASGISVQAQTGLIRAVLSQDLEFVEQMADETTVNQVCEKTKTTPLHVAIQLKNREIALEIAQVLLNRGAHWDVQDAHGRTAQDWANTLRFEEMIELLISHGAPGFLANL